jgi:DNA (cytosine-5)-methyltransferase 1
MSKLSAIDLFCGIGGLSYGLREEGIDILVGVDTDETCRFAFETNVGATFDKRSVEAISGAELNTMYHEGDIRILVGCAPCQPFSNYTKGQSPGEKWKLLRQFSRLIVESQPDIISMENVPQLEQYSIFDQFVKTLKRNGYSVSHKIVFCPDYGMAQHRSRLVLLASKLGPIELIRPTHTKEIYLKVRDVIGSLPKINAGESSEADSFHRARKLTEINLKRIKISSPGKTWRDWPESLQLKCHKKESGKTYLSVYGRMSWNELAPTMTTHCCGLGNGRFGHPEQDRAISLREAALLQAFPPEYVFESEDKKLTQKVLCRQIGNAVPVKLGSVIGRSIKEHVENR